MRMNLGTELYDLKLSQAEKEELIELAGAGIWDEESPVLQGWIRRNEKTLCMVLPQFVKYLGSDMVIGMIVAAKTEKERMFVLETILNKALKD